MTKDLFENLRNEVSLKAKNGLDFTLAAGIIWFLIAFIWTTGYTAYNKSVFTFIAGALMLPLAFLFSKLLSTTWTIPENPLQPLGLQLNFAQLFYFPFLVFVLLKMPEYFVMTYAIITGAHFFPYAWFFKTPLYAIFAGLISAGSLLLALLLPGEKMYIVPLFTALSLILLTVLLYVNSKQKTAVKQV